MFHCHAVDGAARSGTVTTPHGRFATPAFMPVGTGGAIKGLTVDQLNSVDAEIILANTYHLYLRPGHERIARLGGLGEFTGWRKPTLTDSGGYQVLSLSNKVKISEDGVTFASIHDGSSHFFSPERAIDIQRAIGADIIMCFDHCPPATADREYARRAMKRTSAWARRCRGRFDLGELSQPLGAALFGIAQGWLDTELRRESVEDLLAIGFPGYAIGGLAVGESKEVMEEMVAFTAPLLPADKPRYLMGVGYPDDILMAVSYGVDMFDCVLPTRSARTGLLFTSSGPIVYRNASFADDATPPDPACACAVCQRHSRAYLRHLFNQGDITGLSLATYHNVWFYLELMRNIRASIREGRFAEFRKAFLTRYHGVYDGAAARERESPRLDD